MLDFFYKFQKDRFSYRALHLQKEINSILAEEGIRIQETEKNVIDEDFRILLGKKKYRELNNTYYTIIASGRSDHPLLRKYLDVGKKEPQSDFLFGDFFSGAGGLSCGFENAGFEPAFVNDKDLAALETYYFNHSLPLDRIFGDDIQILLNKIEDLRPLFKNIKVVAGGPPCQGFSMANRQRLIDDPRNILYKDFLIFLSEIRPDFFVIENVPGMRRKILEIEKDIRYYTGTDYTFTELLLNAKDFGIPQNRERFFLIGNKVGVNNIAISTNIINLAKSQKKHVLADALFGLPSIKTNPFKLKINYESPENGYMIKKLSVPQNDYLKDINKGIESDYLFNHKSRYNNENDLEIFSRLPQGANSLHESIRDLNKYANRNKIFKDKYYRLSSSAPSKTITSHMKYDCHMYIHPNQPRGLSPRESARIQTFPDNYLFRGNLNDWYNQIGNAVPVKMAEVIAGEIMKFYK